VKRLGLTAKRAVVFTGGILTTALLLGGPPALLAQVHPSLPACQAGDPNLLLPDLIAETPTQLRNTHRTGGRVIAFTSAIGNIGDGPLLMEGRTVSTNQGMKTQAWQVIRKRDGSECARLAGEFIFHPAHFHWHFERFVGYELLDSGNRLVAGGQKTTFCLMDTGLVRGYNVVAYGQQTAGNNCAPEGRQGISVGWKDIYLHNYADQFVQLDRDVPYGPVPTGGYTLVNHVDPDGLIWETNRANNRTTTGAGVSEPPPSTGYTPPPTPTPRGVRPPNVIPPRERPTRPPRDIIRPRERPTREPRPTRPPRGGVTVPTATPRPRPGQTPSGGGNQGSSGQCNTSCYYSLSQVRMTWYNATGLNLSAMIGPGNCAPPTVFEGDKVNVEMYDWLKWDRTDTGINVSASFDIGRNLSGQSGEGSVNFARLGEQLRLGLNLSAPAPSNGNDGNDFPVVFQTCLHIGSHQVPMRLVCQPKSTGMLCHL